MDDNYTTGQIAVAARRTPYAVRKTAEQLGVMPTTTPGGHARFSRDQGIQIVNALSKRRDPIRDLMEAAEGQAA